jgi:hypothetical protein
VAFPAHDSISTFRDAYSPSKTKYQPQLTGLEEHQAANPSFPSNAETASFASSTEDKGDKHSKSVRFTDKAGLIFKSVSDKAGESFTSV